MVFVWVFPGNNLQTKQEGFTTMMCDYPGIRVHILNDRASLIFYTLTRIKKIVNGTDYDLALIGITAPFFSFSLKPAKSVWFINGIPEERESYSRSIKLKLLTKIEWFLLSKLRSPDLIVTVSSRMTSYLRHIFRGSAFIAIPTTVDLPTYQKKRDCGAVHYFTYLGSGAPWQSLDLLSLVWQELNRLDATIRFRVISRDHRTKVLGYGLPQNSIEFVATEDFAMVAHYLSESEVGFLIRKDSLVNRVCFPTKVAEYLAAGCWLVTSDIDWDIGDYVRKYNIGLLVDPKAKPEAIAKLILNKRSSLILDQDLHDRMNACVIDLSRQSWKEKLQNYLRT